MKMDRSKPEKSSDPCRIDHGSIDDKSRYKKLGEKRKKICEELKAVDSEMKNLVSSMLENRNVDDTMKSIYEMDYERRGFPIGRYTSLMTASIDSKIGSPILPAIDDLRDGYRDPARFRYSAIEKFDKLSTPCTTDDQSLITSKPSPNRSEYMETYSKTALITMKNRQQYKNPLIPAKIQLKTV